MKNILSIFLFTLPLLFASNGMCAVEVFVSIGPQKWLAERVGGDRVEVSRLVSDGQDPHTFEPSPRQVASLTGAALWLTMDMEFEEQLRAKVSQVAPNLKIIDLAHDVEKIAMHDEDEHSSGGQPHGHDVHEGDDPHVWLSPVNLINMAGEVAEALTMVDGGSAEYYSQNLQRLVTELDTLHSEIREIMSPFKGASFYVFHPSFGYFAHEYGLKQEAVETGGKSPSPRQLGRLINKAKTDQVKVIFVQPQFDPKSARAVAAAIGGEVVPLDALAEDVASNLRTMAERIESALR